MEAASIQSKTAPTTVESLPDLIQGLVYEVMDGQIIFYRGYQEVLRGNKTLEEIMGSSGLQSLIISCVVEFLLQTLPKKEYKVLYSELGLHLGKHDNVALDIAVYKKELLKKVNNKYLEVAPQLVFEIDTKADYTTLGNPMDYINIKTKKLLAFGVQEVIWVFSKSQMLIVAKPETDWLIKDWKQGFKVLETYDFNLEKLLADEDIDIEE